MTAKRHAVLPVLIVLVAAAAAAEDPARHPFPQNLSYIGGSLKPSHRSVELLSSDVVFAFRRWRGRYLHLAGVEADGHPRYRVTLLGLLVMTGNYWDPTQMTPAAAAPRMVLGRRAP